MAIVVVATVIGLVLTGVLVVGGARLAGFRLPGLNDSDEVTLSNVTDPGLRDAIGKAGDTNKDGKLSKSERLAVKALAINKSLTVKGLGTMFPNLASLELTGGKATSLDISDAPHLTSLNVASEPIKVLDVSRTPNLADLKVNDATVLMGMDKVKALKEVWLPGDLTFVDGSGFTQYYKVSRDDNDRITDLTSERVYVDAELNNFTFDGKGRVSAYDAFFEGAQINPRRVITYDSAGRQVADKVDHLEQYATDTLYDELYAYDARGNLKTYTFDALGGNAYNYTYDNAGRLERISSPGDVMNPAFEASYTWTKTGKLASSTVNGGADGLAATTIYEYDGQNRLVQATSSETNGGSFSLTYSYDGNGRIVTVTAASPGTADLTLNLTYDRFGNITEATGSDGSAFKTSYKRRIIQAGTVLERGWAVRVQTSPVGFQRFGGLEGLLAVDYFPDSGRPILSPDGSLR